MGRVYIPVWCKIDNCKECDIDRCNRRILNLFEPYRDVETPFNKRPKHIEVTTMAIYFGFCQVLANFCLQFPQDSLPVVRNNFINSVTGFPTNQSIQRIFLDMLDRGDPSAPTDEVHRYRLLFFSHDVNVKKRGLKLVCGDQDREISFSKEEIEEMIDAMKKWHEELLSGKLTYKKTPDSLHCKYCFLDDCEKV